MVLEQNIQRLIVAILIVAFVVYVFSFAKIFILFAFLILSLIYLILIVVDSCGGRKPTGFHIDKIYSSHFMFFTLFITHFILISLEKNDVLIKMMIVIVFWNSLIYCFSYISSSCKKLKKGGESEDSQPLIGNDPKDDTLIKSPVLDKIVASFFLALLLATTISNIVLSAIKSASSSFFIANTALLGLQAIFAIVLIIFNSRSTPVARKTDLYVKMVQHGLILLQLTVYTITIMLEGNIFALSFLLWTMIVCIYLLDNSTNMSSHYYLLIHFKLTFELYEKGNQTILY